MQTPYYVKKKNRYLRLKFTDHSFCMVVVVVPHSHWLYGSLCNDDDGDGNQNGKKAIG